MRCVDGRRAASRHRVAAFGDGVVEADELVGGTFVGKERLNHRKILPRQLRDILRSARVFVQQVVEGAVRSGRDGRSECVGQALIVVTGVNERSHADLSQVAQALGGARPHLGLRQRRQEHRGEDRDDRDDDQQFDQGKSA